MKVLAKLILALYVKLFAIAIAACVLLVLVAHLSLGEKSPGIVSITQTASRFWIPLVAILCVVLPTIFAIRIVWLAYRQASGMGFSLTEYFEMPREEQERRAIEYREEGSS